MGIRAEQKEKRYKEILDQSLDLFIHKGFPGTSVRDIAAAVHSSPALLFHYFGSKDDILIALLAMAMGGVQSANSMLSGEGTPIEQFDSIARMIFESFSNCPESAPLFLLVHQVAIFDSMPEKAKEIIGSIPTIENSIPVVIEGQKRGEIRPGDPALLAVTFWSAIGSCGNDRDESRLPDPRSRLDHRYPEGALSEIIPGTHI